MLSRRYRIAAPFAVTGLIAVGAWVPTLRASAAPDLPAVSAHQLVERVLDTDVDHFSGTFAWDADLGLPSLDGLTDGSGQDPSSASGFDPTSLLSGDHSFEVWVDGAGEQRIAAPGTLEETDVVHHGRQAWVYDSSTDHVTHYLSEGSAPGETDPMPAGAAAPTPAAVADEVLATIGSAGTDISVSRAVEVAGRPAYVLRLAPDRSLAANRASTVSSATIAVDATTGLPLQVSVYAVGQAAPALRVGFTSISYATPAASEFDALHGQTTTTKVVPADARSGWHGAGGLSTTSTASSTAGQQTAPPGSWISTGDLNAMMQGRKLVIERTPATEVAATATSTAIPATATKGWAAIGTFPLGDLGPAATSEIDSDTTVVSGSWGSGRLLTSSLVNALILPSGRVLVGAVTPAALEAAAAPVNR